MTNEELKEIIERVIIELNNSKESKKAEEPIRMSKLEYSILKYLADNTRHLYICRDKNGTLFLYDFEPHKDECNGWWVGKGVEPIRPFDKLFQFIKWEDKKPRAVKEILKNGRVIADEVIYHEVVLHE